MTSTFAFAADQIAISTTRDGERAVYYYLGGNNAYFYIGGSAAWRNNNPGNLRSSSSQIGHDGNFAIFSSYSQGYSAMKNLIFNSSTYAGLDIDKMLRKYAPKSENDTETYISFVESVSGMSRYTSLSSMSSSQQADLLAAMIRMEGYIKGTVEFTQIIVESH